VGNQWVICQIGSVVKAFGMWWPETELNRRRPPFQGCALPSVSADSATTKLDLEPFYPPSFWNHNGTKRNQKSSRRGLPQPISPADIDTQKGNYS